MASISTDGGGNKMIQFIAADRKRRTIRLGKVPKKTAESVKGKVEALNAAKIAGHSVDNERARWVAEIGDDRADKLADVGLIPRRATDLLGTFLTDYITQRTDIKLRTRINLLACRSRLVEYFGES